MGDSKAGASAQRSYKEMSRSWRRRKARVFATVAATCSTVGVASYVGGRMWPALAWVFGLMGGAALAFFVCLWESPPGWIENWLWGALGEQATGKVLARLDRDQWSVLHDIQTARGNVDHVVVGPGGVFVLDSKRPGGLVEVHGETVRVRRFEDPDLAYTFPSPLPVSRQAAETSSRMAAATRIRQWVIPVMVVWAEFPQRTVDGDVAVVHGDALVEWLENCPRRIAPENIGRITAAVRAAWAVEAPE